MKKMLFLLLFVGCSCDCETPEFRGLKKRCERAGGEVVAVRRATDSPVDMRTYSVIEWVCVVQ